MQTLKMLVLFSWLAVFSCAEKPAVTAEKMKLRAGSETTTEKLKWMSLDDAAAGLKK
jgi:hypothetical protein